MVFFFLVYWNGPVSCHILLFVFWSAKIQVIVAFSENPTYLLALIKSLTSQLWKQDKPKKYVSYFHILFWEICKDQAICLELNPKHKLKCIMNPHLLCFGTIEFTSGISLAILYQSGNPICTAQTSLPISLFDLN